MRSCPANTEDSLTTRTVTGKRARLGQCVEETHVHMKTSQTKGFSQGTETLL